MKRIVWLAVADARGHLMRAHLAQKILAPEVQVEILTTSDAGAKPGPAAFSPAL